MTDFRRAAERIRDIVARAPADDLIELLALAALDAEERKDSCRAMALAALDLLAERDVEIDRLRRQLGALREELRAHRRAA